MNLIYNSEHYSVVEFGAQAGMETMRFGGYEILDKPARRETFIAGPLAEAFRQHVRELIASEPSVEDVDEFLSGYGSLMGNQSCFTRHIIYASLTVCRTGCILLLHARQFSTRSKQSSQLA
jgi:hypothetical protein